MRQMPVNLVSVLSAVFLLSFVFLLAVAFASGGASGPGDGGSGSHNSSKNQSPPQPTPPAAQCVVDADCGPGAACVESFCMPVLCNFTADCGQGLSCKNSCIPAHCTSDANCAQDQSCIKGLCLGVPPPCNSTADCDQGHICKKNFCIPLPAPCNSTADCNPGHSCTSICMPVPCNSTADCGPDQSCEDHGCVPSPCNSSTDCNQEQSCQSHACITIPCSCGSVQNHQCVEYACCADSECGQDKACQNHACSAVPCACGVVQNHQCTPYACCLDSDCSPGLSCKNHLCALPPPPCNSTADCGQNGTCQNNTCVAFTVTPGGGGNLPSTVPFGGACNATSQCLTELFCDKGLCSNVTGECGYVANHSWVSYACGPEPGCPTCPAGNICIGHGCTQPASITIAGKNLVGENMTLTVTYPSGPCSACALQFVSPSGARQNGTTDAGGKFTLALNEKGTYNVTLVREGRAVSIVALVPSSPQGTSLATLLYTTIVGSPAWLFVLLLMLVGLALYLRRRGK